MLLAIDTSAGTSVAIVAESSEIVAERSSADTRLHAEVIGEFIADVIAEARLDRSAITAVVAGMGPGPFTGLRVGIAAAHAFALGSRVPLLRVVSHDAVAFASASAGATGPVLAGPVLVGPALVGPLLVVTDARRREVYWSTYGPSGPDGIPVRTAGPALARPDDLSASVDDYAEHTRIDAAEVSAGALGQVAALLLTSGGPFADEGAIYLRSPDVTVSAGPKRVTG